MSREIFVRNTCERCKQIEEGKKRFLSKYPKGWKKVEGKWLCGKCKEEYQSEFKKFMDIKK